MQATASNATLSRPLQGKTAIVTGSTSGIGLGIAEAFAAAGAHVVLNGFGKPEEIEKIRSELSAKHGIQAIYSAADMTKPAEIRSMVETAAKKFGAVDVLVNNAGIQHVEAIETFPPEKWDQIIAINMSAAFHSIAAAIRA